MTENKYLKLIFTQIDKVKAINKIVGQLNHEGSNAKAFNLLGKYDLLILEEQNTLEKQPNLLSNEINKNLKATFSISAFEHGRCNNKKNFFDSNYYLITLINLYNPIFLKKNLEKIQEEFKIEVSSFEYSKYSRFRIMDEFLDFAKQKKLESRIYGGFGRNEIITITKLNATSPLSQAYDFLFKINNIVLLYKNGKYLFPKALDSSSMIAFPTKKNYCIKTESENKITSDEEIQLTTLLSTECILETVDFSSLVRKILGSSDFEIKPVIGFYDYIIEWKSNGLENCLDDILCFKTKIENGKFLNGKENLIYNIQTNTFLPSKEIQKYNYKDSQFISINLNLLPCKNNKNCELFDKKRNYNQNLHPSFLLFALDKLYDLDTIITNAYNDPSSQDSLRNICFYLVEIYKKIDYYSKSEEAIEDIIWNPLLFPEEYISAIRENRNKIREEIFISLNNLQTLIQQRLSNLQQTKLIGGRALEITHIPMNYEQIIFAAEAICYYTSQYFPGATDIVKCCKWPLIVIGLDDSFALIAPGLINLPYSCLYSPFLWGGIAHETIHFLYNNADTKEPFFKELDLILRDFLKIATKKYDYDFCINFFEDLLNDMFLLNIVFDFNLNTFLIANISNINRTLFRWENLARLLIVVTFSFYKEFTRLYRERSFEELVNSNVTIKYEDEKSENFNSSYHEGVSILILDILNTFIINRDEKIKIINVLQDFDYKSKELFDIICYNTIEKEGKKITIFELLYNLFSDFIKFNGKKDSYEDPSKIINKIFDPIFADKTNKKYVLSIDNFDKVNFESYKSIVNYLSEEKSKKNNITAIIDLIKWQENSFLNT